MTMKPVSQKNMIACLKNSSKSFHISIYNQFYILYFIYIYNIFFIYEYSYNYDYYTYTYMYNIQQLYENSLKSKGNNPY